MIHPDTQVQYIDMRDGEPRYKSINEFYQEYCHKAILKMDTNNVQESIIDFSLNPHVKITDLFGWTDVLEIKRFTIRYPLTINWINILVKDKKLITCNRELLPVYDINDNKIGFHGEVKYKYTLTSPVKLSSGYLRTNNCEDENGNQVEFIIPEIVDLGNYNIDYSINGYEIITRSGFYNGNNIHLFGSDYIREPSNCYK